MENLQKNLIGLDSFEIEGLDSFQIEELAHLIISCISCDLLLMSETAITDTISVTELLFCPRDWS